MRITILFSSTYGINNIDTGKFYDRKPNMLNVAVSRAKDSFIVFGSPHFGISGNDSPSKILMSKLKT